MTTANMTCAPRDGGLQRKSLAQQLDRLDQILDGLSDGLQAAVVDAVKGAVGQAVQLALREVLTHPALVARLGSTPVPAGVPAHAPTIAPTAMPTASRASWTGRLWAKIRSCVSRLRNRWSDFADATREAVKQTGRCVARIARVGWTLVRYNSRAVVLALFVGMAAGAACYFAGPLISAAVSGAVAGILAGLARLLAPLVGMSAVGNDA